MNSKERVKNAIALRPVDRIPLGLYAIDCDTIAKVIGRKTYLRNRLDFPIAIWEGRRDEAVESMKQDITDLFTKLDCIDLITFKESQQVPPRGFVPEDPPKKIDDSTYADSKGNVYRISIESNAIMQVSSERQEPEPDGYFEAMYADRTVPAPPDESSFELLDHLVAVCGTDRYIAGYSSGCNALALLGGMERGLMTLALQPEVVKAHNRQKVFQQNYLDQFYIRPGIDGVHMEQDFGGTEAPLISPDMFHELVHPFLQVRIANVKKHVTQVSFHSCGNTMPLMDMIIDAGVDCYESIQTNAREISVKALAAKYGDRLCIWGSVPLEVLISGSPLDTRKAVRANIAAAAEAEGYILGPSHSIAYGTKYDNFMAMLDEFEKRR